MAEKDIHYYEPANGHGLNHDPFNASSHHGRSAGFPRAMPRGISTSHRTAFSTPFAISRRLLASPPQAGRTAVSNIQETEEFCWNLSIMDLAKQMNATSAHVAHDVNEFTIAGLTATPSKIVGVPRVAESPVSFECRLSEIVQLKRADGEKAEAWLTLGEVVAVHIDKAFIKGGVYQTALARPIARAGRRGDYFEIRPDAMFEMARPD